MALLPMAGWWVAEDGLETMQAHWSLGGTWGWLEGEGLAAPHGPGSSVQALPWKREDILEQLQPPPLKDWVRGSRWGWRGLGLQPGTEAGLKETFLT